MIGCGAKLKIEVQPLEIEWLLGKKGKAEIKINRVEPSIVGGMRWRQQHFSSKIIKHMRLN